MGLFNKLFNNSNQPNEDPAVPWIDLNDISQLQDIKDKSLIKLQVIFKHSTRCGISKMVKNQFVKDYTYEAKDIDLYYLDLLAHRNMSNTIAELFNVVHESPQVLVIKNGSVVVHESHGSINDLDLKRFI